MLGALFDFLAGLAHRGERMLIAALSEGFEVLADPDGETRNHRQR